jgi:hypothetical protein
MYVNAILHCGWKISKRHGSRCNRCCGWDVLRGRDAERPAVNVVVGQILATTSTTRQQVIFVVKTSLEIAARPPASAELNIVQLVYDAAKRPVEMLSQSAILKSVRTQAELEADMIAGHFLMDWKYTNGRSVCIIIKPAQQCCALILWMHRACRLQLSIRHAGEIFT